MAGELVDPTKLTVGVSFALMTSQKKLVLQRRTEKGSSLLKGKSFRGELELPGGRAKEGDLRKLLILSALFEEGRREVWEELRVDARFPTLEASFCPFYRAVFAKGGGVADWAFVFVIPPNFWDEKARRKRETVEVSPREIRELANLSEGERLLGGWGKRMCRMSLGGFILLRALALFGGLGVVENSEYSALAADYLNEIKPRWDHEEFFMDPEEALNYFRREELHLE